ncbi:MAG TPA: DNA repair protein RecN [Holophagaceae bacterium]|nr:DNA repair protein RecN [Holophagaceae bacterium]
MLASLRIQNLALVEDLSLELGQGFTVLTGETGAGKSLLVDALSLLVGARADGELVRRGADRAVAEGVVEGDGAAWLAFLQARGLPEEHPVVLRREIGGRARAWINGAPCAVGDLKEAGRLWMRLASQHDHQSLLAEERHLVLLDEVLGIAADLSAEAEAVRGAAASLKARRRSEEERESRLSQLAEHLAEMEKLGPKPAEWDQLRAEREPLRHAAVLEHAYAEGAGALDRALPELEAAQRALAKAAAVWPEAGTEQDRLRSALLEIEDLVALAQDHARHWAEGGEARLEKVESRLAAFEKLARRHRCEPGDLAETWTTLKLEQKDLLGGSASLEELERALAKAAEVYRAAAEIIHRKREASLVALETEAHRRLAGLGMKGARLQVRLGLAEEASSPVLQNGKAVRVAPEGFSAAALWIESNPGEGFRPLAKIASGGELSRVMLSLMGAGLSMQKGAEASSLTLVLDEVDAGIGGETALAVGRAIAELAARHQVLCVTHLAQVAARAGSHLYLAKEVKAGRTRSGAAWVAGDARVRELARLLSGHPDRPEALEHAKLLLA